MTEEGSAQPGEVRTMNEQEELAQLEAERDRLLSMIAYHDSPYYQKSAGRRTGPITLIGFEFCLTDLIDALGMKPSGPPAGEREVVQRLADCEARIVKLKATTR
jgi:hypothetical protein